MRSTRGGHWVFEVKWISMYWELVFRNWDSLEVGRHKQEGKQMFYLLSHLEIGVDNERRPQQSWG